MTLVKITVFIILSFVCGVLVLSTIGNIIGIIDDVKRKKKEKQQEHVKFEELIRKSEKQKLLAKYTDDYIIENSPLLKTIKGLNEHYSFVSVKTHYPHNCLTKPEYDRFDPDQFFSFIAYNNYSKLQQSYKDVQHNQENYGEYVKKVNYLRSNPTPMLLDNGIVKNREMFLFNQRVIDPVLTFDITIEKKYISPKNRNYYNQVYHYTYDDFIEAAKNFHEGKIEYERRKAQMDFERSKITAKLRYQVLARDNSRCVICGASSNDGITKLHVDHIVPIAKGGLTELSNLQTLCESCNLGKSDSLPIELSNGDMLAASSNPSQKSNSNSQITKTVTPSINPYIKKAQINKAVEKQLKKEKKQDAKAKNTNPQSTNESKAITQLDDYGNIIHRYRSINEASRETGINKKSLRYAATGVQKHAGGFVWKFDTSIDGQSSQLL